MPKRTGTRSRRLAVTLFVVASAVTIGVGLLTVLAPEDPPVTIPTTSVGQTSSTSLAVAVSASGGDRWRFILRDGATRKIVYDTSGSSRTGTITIPAKPSTAYTFVGCAFTDDQHKCAPPKTLTTAPRLVQFNPVTVATYNVCAEFCPVLEPWSTRVTRIVAQVTASGADVFGSVEAGVATDEVTKLDASLGSAWTRIAGATSRYLYIKNATTSSTSADGDPLPSGTLQVQARPGQSKLTAIPYAMLRNTRNDSRYVIVLMHLTSQDGVVPDTDRLGEAKLTVSQITSAVTSKFAGVPVVYMGDLNSLLRRHIEPFEGDFERYRVNDYFATLGYSDVVDRATGPVNASESSFNINEKVDFRNLGPGFRLDHIFTTADVRASAWKLWNQGGPYAAQLSDHDMVSATLVLPTY